MGQIATFVFSVAASLAGLTVQAGTIAPVAETAPVAAPVPATPVSATPVPATEAAPIGPVATPPVPEQTPEATGEVVVRARGRRGDPLEAVNEVTFDATQAIDRAVVAPASSAYRKAVPQPVRAGLRNFLANLREPVAMFNYLLQLKIGKAFETAGRFGINTTIGLAGVLDVAKRKPFRLPRRRNSFANTLGFYGVKPGAFLFVPLLGPTTVRDLIGTIFDQVAVPISPVQPLRQGPVAIPVAILSSLDFRAEFNEELERQRATGDAYGAARNSYLDRRQAEIDALHGRRFRLPRVPVPEPTRPVIYSEVDLLPLPR